MCQPRLRPGPGSIIINLPSRCRRLSLLAKGCAPSGSPSAGRFFRSPSFAIHPFSSAWSNRELSSSSSVAWGGSMRGRGRKLTHLGCHTLSSSSFAFCTTTTTSTPTTPTPPKMASNDGPQWTAQRVRDTFLNYFQENGHSFGALLPRHRDFFFGSSLSLALADSLLLSYLLSCRAPVRPNAAFHQCGHEPVQIHLPGYRRPTVRLCQVEARRELAKGRIHSQPQTRPWLIIDLVSTCGRKAQCECDRLCSTGGR